MNLRCWLLVGALLLSGCQTDPNRQHHFGQKAIAAAAKQAVTRQEPAKAGDFFNDPTQDMNGHWHVTLGKIDFHRTLLDQPSASFVTGTGRELIFSQEGKLLSYRKTR